MPEFYRQRDIPQQAARFNVFPRENFDNRLMPYNRRDFYKIALLLGTSRLMFADKDIVIDRPALNFSNPLVPYSWEATSPEQTGYFCLFTEEFLKVSDRSDSLQESPLFKIGSNPIFFLSDQQVAFVSDIFQKMLAEMASDYVHKHDLLRNYVNVIIHEALKMQPSDAYTKPQNAAARIASLFLELLERQFPVDSPGHPLQLKTASDFATNLSVHVNHLNQTVRDVTGKSTTQHITERIVVEAKALLKNTDWSIAEIAYSLGFEYPNYFNSFFKKHTGIPPQRSRFAR